MYVSPTQRGQGISQRLMKQVVDMARRVPGLLQLTLAAGSQNAAALAVYRAPGLRTVGTMPRALIVDGKMLEETLMICDLDREAPA